MATVFDLLGDSENDMTSSTGWALTRSPTLLRLLLERVAPGTNPGMFIGVRLQESSDLGGYTDIEIETENLFVIVEAKRGWQLPRCAQLELYAQRLQRRAKQGVLVVLSECSREFAGPRLPKTIGQVPVCHLSWRDVVALGRASACRGARAERPVLRDLCDDLEGLIHMPSQQSNLVYVVVIAEGSPPPEPHPLARRRAREESVLSSLRPRRLARSATRPLGISLGRASAQHPPRRRI